MKPATSPDALSSFAELEALYFSTPLAAIDRQALAQWRPATTLWGRLKPLIARQAGAAICSAEVAGHRLHYWDSGDSDKPVLVLLHGFGASKENWSYLAPLLRSRYRILAPDLPGFGSSTYRSDDCYRVDTQAQRIATWLQQMGVTSANLAGSSMGGAIAALIAARHPSLVAGLCLMNAAGAPARRISMLEAGILGGNNVLVAKNFRETRRLFQVCFHPEKRALGTLFSLLMAGDMRHRSVVNHAIFADLVRSLESAYIGLSAIAAPTLVLWGDSDQILDVTCVDAFTEQIPHAKAMVMPEVGHLPMLEKPRETALVLQAFLAQRTVNIEPARIQRIHQR